MVSESVARMAARRLSVDVANLSFRLALLEAGRDELAEALELLNPDSWTRTAMTTDTEVSTEGDVASGGPVSPEPLPVVTIVGDQVAILERVLRAVYDLL